MARGDKNYDKTVRKVKGQKSEKKIAAIHKMVEALIAGDVEAAAEASHIASVIVMQRNILGEKADEAAEEEKEEAEDEDTDKEVTAALKKAVKAQKKDEEEDEKDEKGKKDLKENNLTKAKSAHWLPTTDRSVHGNSLKNKPKTSNDTGAKGVTKLAGADKGKISGNALKTKPHKSNDTKAQGVTKLPGTKDKKPAKYDDSRDYDMGTMVSERRKLLRLTDDEILDSLDESLLDSIYTIVTEEKPSAGMSKKEKSSVVKRARRGEDIGKPGKKFKEVQASAAKRYGSEEAGRRVAAAAMWKQQGK